MSTIAAGTTSGTALVSTGNTDGTLQLQVNGTTPSVTLATTGAIGVGSTPGYGTSGQVLTSGGSAAAPSWATISSSPWVVLSSGTISSVSAVDFETGFTDTSYIAIVIILNNVFSDGSGNASFRFKQSGSYTASGYYSQVLEASLSSVGTSRNGSSAQMVFSGAQVLNSSSYNAMLIMNNRFNTTAANPSLSTLNQCGSGVASISLGTGANYSVGGAVTGVRFLLSGGGGSTTLVSGTYTSYGIKAA